VIYFVGLLFVGLAVVLTVRPGSGRRWARYIAAAGISAFFGCLAGFAWYDAVLCTEYSTECDVGIFYGILWAIVGAVGCLVIGGVIEIVIAGRGPREPDQYDEPSA
jgi:hypothetical protein